jgi:exosortase/archaeosortase family protein
METKSHETFISSNEFTLNVGKGCDALSPLVLLLAGILTFPITFKYKIPALVVAPIAVFILNLVRIISLYFIGLSLPDFFEIAHVEIWQTLFIVACLIGWLYWLIWATKKQTHENT